MSLMERLERLNLVDGQLRGLSVRVEKATSFHRAQTKQLDLEKKRAEEAKANLLQVKAAYGVVETEAKALDEQIQTARERMDTPRPPRRNTTPCWLSSILSKTSDPNWTRRWSSNSTKSSDWKPF